MIIAGVTAQLRASTAETSAAETSAGDAPTRPAAGKYDRGDSASPNNCLRCLTRTSCALLSKELERTQRLFAGGLTLAMHEVAESLP